MKIGIFGLGYVGCVMAACLVSEGHQVVGIDVNPLKVDMINAGRSPIIETGLQELIRIGRSTGNLKASLSPQYVVSESEISVICVGTPSNENGSLKLEFVENVCQEIGTALKEVQHYHLVVIRSTVLPGTVEKHLIPILEKYSGKKAGVHFGVCMNPEFLREGSAIKDYRHPSFVMIGELDQRSGDALEAIYTGIQTEIVRSNIRTAEMVKYTCNAFHALKVVFGNEIGTIAKFNGVDGQEVMDIICKDSQLNISPKYLQPGFAFGGSCLPKDLRAILYRAKELDVELPTLKSLLQSNQQHIQAGIRMIEKTQKHRIGIFGMSFKAGTDDVRESPVITLVETLIGRGYQVRIYDENIQLARMVGANKQYLEEKIPHITTLMIDTVDALIEHSEVLVVTNSSEEFQKVPSLIKPDQILIDFVGKVKPEDLPQDKYEGICW
jgi:GDP-mannose 6-dehydrogenase